MGIAATNGHAMPGVDVFSKVGARTRCDASRRKALEDVVQLAVEIAREGREGRKIGTLFVVGDGDQVRERSRQLILDPLHGHAAELLRLDRPEFRETVKELAQLDGAFLVDDDGTFRSAGRYVEVDLSADASFVSGLGTRHAAAASITSVTDAVAVVVSQSSVVRVLARGAVKAEIIPELYLMAKERLFAAGAELEQVPEAGLTVALAD
jgi:DNA integrity scanning protein DisA with diadenylate cyclase activity